MVDKMVEWIGKGLLCVGIAIAGLMGLAFLTAPIIVWIVTGEWLYLILLFVTVPMTFSVVAMLTVEGDYELDY